MAMIESLEAVKNENKNHSKKLQNDINQKEQN